MSSKAPKQNYNRKKYAYPLKNKELTVKELSKLIKKLHPYPLKEEKWVEKHQNKKAIELNENV